MKDKYLSKELIAEYYKKAQEDLKEAYQNSSNHEPIKMQDQHFQAQMRKLEEMYDKIKSRNKKNKLMRSVHSKKSKCLIL